MEHVGDGRSPLRRNWPPTGYGVACLGLVQAPHAYTPCLHRSTALSENTVYEGPTMLLVSHHNPSPQYSLSMSEISNALFVDLTKPEATKEFAVTDLSKKLIEWVGLDVIRFRRNQQVAHRIVDHGRETYDQINGVIDTIDEDPGEETDYDKFTKYTDAVEE